jgi:lysozyme family protein
MSDVNLAVDQLLKDEGGNYTPDDYGRGPSRWGITLATYRQFFSSVTAETIEQLSEGEAAQFYRFWWRRYNINDISDQALAAKCFNIGFNVGPQTAIMILQRTLGVADDGILGPETANAANSCDAATILMQYKARIVLHYQEIVAAHPERIGDLPGWIARANR